jgi:hypothetical protein
MSDAREELEDWLNGSGKQPSFDPQVLPDGFYKIEFNGSSRGAVSVLKHIISETMKLCGETCSLNWIDVTQVKNMNWLFSQSVFNGDVSRWDVSNVEDM